MELKKFSKEKKKKSQAQGFKDSRTQRRKDLGTQSKRKKTSVLQNQSKDRKEIEEAKAKQHSSIIDVRYRVYIIKVIVPFFR